MSGPSDDDYGRAYAEAGREIERLHDRVADLTAALADAEAEIGRLRRWRERSYSVIREMGAEAREAIRLLEDDPSPVADERARVPPAVARELIAEADRMRNGSD